MPDEPSSPRHRRLRIAVAVSAWLLMFAWSFIPPFRGQILEKKASMFVWHWQLYSRAGTGICDVRYYDMNNGGEPLERWTLLGYERPGDMPDHVARTKKKQLLSTYKRVCLAAKRAGDPEPNIRVSARCAEKGRWKQVEHKRRNVCTIGKKKPKKRKKAKAKAANKNGGQR